MNTPWTFTHDFLWTFKKWWNMFCCSNPRIYLRTDQVEHGQIAMINGLVEGKITGNIDFPMRCSCNFFLKPINCYDLYTWNKDKVCPHGIPFPSHDTTIFLGDISMFLGSLPSLVRSAERSRPTFMLVELLQQELGMAHCRATHGLLGFTTFLLEAFLKQ